MPDQYAAGLNENAGNGVTQNRSGPPPRFYAVLSIGAAVLTIILKLGAFLLTDSVGLLSDAAESVVNLVAACVAFWALTVAALPPDEEHAYGHTKAEYFSSGVEAGLILVAALSIAYAAWGRLLHPEPLTHVWLGLAISALAAGVNGGVALVLLRAGARLNSITLHADAKHLLTDVWTTGGVLVGVVAVKFTGWLILDPILAILVAINICWTAAHLLTATAHGLMDTALEPKDRELVADVLRRYEAEGIGFHALRTRVSGQRRFLSMHVLVPGDWTVQQGHDLCERLEREIVQALPHTTVDTHLEPREDPIAWEDTALDRPATTDTV